MNEGQQEATACQHCGALVYPETKRCPQCGRFPIKLRRCPRCHAISSADADACSQCGRLFEPGGDYL